MFLSTEIFSKRRKIYTIWRETRVYWGANDLLIGRIKSATSHIDGRNVHQKQRAQS